MAYTTPFTAVTGALILASGWNTSARDNLEYLKGRAGTIAFESGATFAGAVTVGGTGGLAVPSVGGASVTGGNLVVSPASNGASRAVQVLRSAGDAGAASLDLYSMSAAAGWSWRLKPASNDMDLLDYTGGGGAVVANMPHAAAHVEFLRTVRGSQDTTLDASAYDDAGFQARTLSVHTGTVGYGFARVGSSGLYLYHGGLAAYLLRIRDHSNNDAAVWSGLYQGAGTGMDADLIDGMNPGNGANTVPISNGTLCTNLVANYATNLRIVGVADYAPGNASGNIPISNGTLCTNLNADLLDGLSSAAFAQINSSPTFTGTVSAAAVASTGAVSGTIWQPSSNVGVDWGGGYFIQTTGGSGIGIGAGGSVRYEQRAASAIFSTLGTYVTSWTAVSDRRLKTAVEPVQGALSKILQLAPITYLDSDLFKETYDIRDPRRKHGLIAQDLKAVFPDLIEGKESETEMLSVDYARLVVPTLAAVQELARRLDTISARLAA